MSIIPGQGIKFLSKRPYITYLQSTEDTAGEVVTHTFPAQNLGTANPKRCIIVGACGRKGLSGAERQIASITVGGIAATLLTKQTAFGGDFSVPAGLFGIPVPLGTTADVVVNFNFSASNCRLSLWSLWHPKAIVTPHDVRDIEHVNGGVSILALPSLSQRNCMITYAASDDDVTALTPPVNAQDFGFGITSAGKHANRTGISPVIPVMTSDGSWRVILGVSW